MENQQFGDEHGLGLNDARVEVYQRTSLLVWFRCLGWCFVFQPRKICGCKYF
jgi:hypothetical protein